MTTNDIGLEYININVDDDEQEVTTPNKYKPSPICCCNIFLLIATFSTVIWALSEAGLYGEGIIRGKLVGETCSTWNGRNCVDGLFCIGGICHKQPKDNIPCTILNNTCPECQLCPPQTVYKQISYFDFREYPSRSLVINTTFAQRIQRIIDNIDYGGCKELCAKDSLCKALCYHGGSRECQLRSSSEGTLQVGTVPGVGWWITAIKT